MPRGYQDPVAQELAKQKEAREEARANAQTALGSRAQALNEQEFTYRQAHDAAAQDLAERTERANAALRYAEMAKAKYEIDKQTRIAEDAGRFHSFLSEISHDDPEAGNKISHLKAAFPQAMNDEGVRATLQNDWSDVLAQRGLSREDREATDKRNWLMSYHTAVAKDDEFAANNPWAKGLAEKYAQDVLNYENKKQGAAGVTPAPAPKLDARSFFAPQPQRQAAEAGSSPAPTGGTPLTTTQPAPAQIEPSAVPQVPPASTPKEQQQSQWANTPLPDNGQ